MHRLLGPEPVLPSLQAPDRRHAGSVSDASKNRLTGPHLVIAGPTGPDLTGPDLVAAVSDASASCKPNFVLPRSFTRESFGSER